MQESIKKTYKLFARQDGEREKIDEILIAYQMRRMTDDEVPALRMIAMNLLGFASAPEEILLKVSHWSDMSLFARHTEGELTGFLAIIPLNREGHKALRSGDMYGSNIEEKWVAHPGEPMEAGLLWGMGGHSARDQRAVVFALLSICKNLFPGMPTYSRAATEHGLRIMVRMGYEKVLSIPDRPDLWGRFGDPVKEVMSTAKYQEVKAQDTNGEAA